MTEEKVKQWRRSVLLPTAASLDVLVRWANRGPDALVTPDGPPRHRQRQQLLVHLRRLVSTLDVPAGLACELAPRHNKDFSTLSPGLLDETARRARLSGFVTASCRERVPLTPAQASTLWQMSWGSSYKDVAERDGCRLTSVAESMQRAREQHGCSTMAYLLATAFRNGWLPDNEELLFLLRGQMAWRDHGAPRSFPPYLWRNR